MRRLRTLGFLSFSDYMNYLDAPEGAGEVVNFCNALTTNLTSFFREKHHFDHFEQEIRRRQDLPGNRLRVWSAGCSTGEEPYSLAMILHGNADALLGRDRRILATDVDTGALEIAMQGSYPTSRTVALPPRLRTGALIDSAAGQQTVSPAVRTLVVFRTLNLVEPWPFQGKFNAIFCRNVLIYFSHHVGAQIVDRFVDSLHPGGFLYLGHSESLLGNHAKLRSVGHTIYRRIVQQ